MCEKFEQSPIIAVFEQVGKDYDQHIKKTFEENYSEQDGITLEIYQKIVAGAIANVLTSDKFPELVNEEMNNMVTNAAKQAEEETVECECCADHCSCEHE